MYTCDPNLELRGDAMHSLVASENLPNYLDVLRKTGLDNIDPERWYPVQKMLDVFNAIGGRNGAMADFVSVGVAAAIDPNRRQDSSSAQSIDEFLQTYGQRWEALHRNGDAGHIQVEEPEHHHFVLTTRTPYPDDVLYGIFYGFVRRLRPRGMAFTVEYDEGQPRRDQGGEVTVIHVFLGQ